MPKIDKVDQEILNEMYAEGEMTDEEYKEKTGQDPPEKEPSEKEKEKEKEKETEGEPSEEEKADEKKKDEEKKSEEGKKKEEEKKEEELITRTPMVPLSKHKKLKDKYHELKDEVAKGTKTEEEAKKEIDEELGKYAEDNKLDKDQLERLIGIITKRVSKPAEKVKEKTDEEKEITDKEKLDARLTKEAAGFESEFDKKVLPILAKKYPKMTAIQERKVKNILHDLAFTKDLAETPLKYIYYGHVKKIREILEVPSKKSGESSRGTGGGIKKKSFGGLPLDREPTEEEFDAASDKEFDEWDKEKEKRSESRLIFRDGNKK
jgi:hypothetical protein